MEILTRVHAKNFVEWAKDKPEVIALSADLTSSTEIDLFRETYPKRFFSMGMAEQNMMGFAGGLAREDFVPHIHTFAVFIYRRAYDQICDSIAYPNLRVRFFGFLPGVTTPGGATHQAIEDLSVMRSLPNMTVIECGDATDVESVLDAIHNVDGPVYVRMLRGEIPRLFAKEEKMQINRARVLSQGDDVTLGIQHLHLTTLKPFNDHLVLESLAKAKRGIITMENHTVIGGVGTATAEMMAEHGIGKKLVKIGLQDTFIHGASKPYLMREYGLDAIALVEQVEKLIGAKLNISENDLAAVRLDAVHSEAKAEAL
ncbi:MAG: transketolase [Chloroflexi bacterium]|nr:transketolase [Chloroflexota bacterium]